MAELIRTNPLELLHLKDAIVSGSATLPAYRTIPEGVYTSEGHLVPLSRKLTAYDEGSPVSAPNADFDGLVKETIDKGIYLGDFYCQFGHLILETASTLWCLEKIHNIQDYKLLYHARQNDQLAKAGKVPMPWLFRKLGMRLENFVFLKHPAVVRELWVPERGFQLGICMNAAMKPVYDKVAEKGDPTQKIYLSRARLRPREGMQYCANEKDVETVFKKHGFHIVYPETLPFFKQLALYARSSVLAGLEGSALHNVLFTRDRTQLIVLGTARRPGGAINNQKICNALKEIDCKAVPYKGKTGPDGMAFNYDLEYLGDKLSQICKTSFTERLRRPFPGKG